MITDVNKANGAVTIKLTDFGLAQETSRSSYMKGKVGSLNYMAPEILMRKPYDNKVDVWSACIVVYAMLSGGQPFYANRKRKIKKAIIQKDVNF